MEQKDRTKVMLGVLMALVVLSGIVSYAGISSVGNVDLTGVNDKINSLNAKVDAVGNLVSSRPTSETPVDLSGIETRLSDIEFNLDEESVLEAKALELAKAELDTKDFKKAVKDALVAYNESVESYKHITKIELKDSDVVVDLDAENATVSMDVKVYYYVDGDVDETEKARLVEFVLGVTNLDKDDDFADAEVSDFPVLEVEKVY